MRSTKFIYFFITQTHTRTHIQMYEHAHMEMCELESKRKQRIRRIENRDLTKVERERQN